jgi:uncharacterized repeat protein (TIGR01451 family)
LGDSSQNDGFGGSDGERDNAEILWYARDNNPASQLTVYSRADNPSELVQDDLLTADSLRGATLHVIVTPVPDGSRVHWRCVTVDNLSDMAACDGQFRESDLTPAQLFALGDDATNNQLWLALNRVIAPETSATSNRLGRGITHAVVWLEPRPLPDLVVRDAVFTETANGCSLDITIANVGQGDVRDNFAFQASPINLASGSGTAWSNAIYGLAAGQQVQQRWQNINVNGSTLSITVDPDDDIDESDDSLASNTFSRPVPTACQGNVTPFDASISKQLEGTLQAGDDARYVITVRTDSPFSQAPTVIDTLPAGVTFVTSPSAVWSCQAEDGQVRCDYQGQVRSGVLEPLVLDVRLADDVTGTVRNCARLNQTDRDASNNEACSNNDIANSTGSSDMRVSQALQGSLREGRLSRIVVQVSNLGPDALSGNVQMTSTLPQGITFLAGNSAAWRCRVGSAQAQAEQVICDYQGNRPIEVGSLPDIIYTVEVASSAADRVTLCSSITADNDSNLSNNRTCDAFDVQRSDMQTSDLTLAKSISGELARGQQGRYVLRVSNLGPAPYAGTLQITDALPVGVRFVEARSSGQVWRCDLSENSNGTETVTCRYLNNDLGVGALPDVTLVVSVAEDAPEQLENCARLQLEPLDANPANNRACTNRDLGQPAPSGFDVDVSQALIGSLQAGSVAATNVQVANLGSANVGVPVTLTSDLPASVRFVSSDTADGSQQRWTCTAQEPQGQQGQRLECTLPPITEPPVTDGWEVGSLPPLNVVFEVAESAPEQLELCFDVLAAGDTNADNNRACVSATVQPAEVEPYDLQLDMTLRGDLRIGQSVRYVVQVSNLGPGSATDTIQVQTRLAQGVQITAIESNEVNARDTWRCQSSGQSSGQNPEIITCTADAPPFAVGSLPSLELLAQVNPESDQSSGEVLTTCATVQAANDSNPNNNDACASGTLQARRADVQLSSSVVNIPTPGGRITLALAVRNAGPDAVDGVTVTTPLPVGFSFVAANSPAWSCNDTRDNLRCTLNAALAVGDAPGLLLELAITPETSGVVTSCSSVTSNQDDITDPNLANNDACQELRVAAPGDLAINKTLDGAENNEVRRGLPAVYTITVTNGNDQALSRVPNVLDTLPTGLELDFVNSDDWTCTLVVGTLDCRYTADSLAAGASSTLQLVTNVLEDAPGDIENCAELSLLDQDASNNRSCVTSTVTRVRDLGVSLELTTPLRAASQSSYRVTVTRNPDNDIDGDGLDDSSNALAPITVTIALPNGLQIADNTFGAWTCELTDTEVVCTLTPADASVAEDAIAVLELPVRVASDATSPLETCAELAPDRDDSNNRACLEREVGAAFTLSLEKTLLESLDAGSESQYRLVGSVRMPEDVADTLEDALENSDEAIILRDDLPVGLQLVSAGNSFWDCSQTSSSGSSQLVCESRASLGTLIDAADDDADDDVDDGNDVVLALEPLILTVRVADDAPARLENCAELAVLGIVERACSNNPVSRRFDLSISKTLPETVLEVGDSYAYRIEVENLGPNAAPSPVTVRDVLPVGVRFRNTPEGLNWTCTNTRNVQDTVTCTYSGATAAGTFTNLLLIVDITADALIEGNPTVIENCAEVLATGETSSSNNRDCVSNRVVP